MTDCAARYFQKWELSRREVVLTAGKQASVAHQGHDGRHATDVAVIIAGTPVMLPISPQSLQLVTAYPAHTAIFPNSSSVRHERNLLEGTGSAAGRRVYCRRRRLRLSMSTTITSQQNLGHIFGSMMGRRRVAKARRTPARPASEQRPPTVVPRQKPGAPCRQPEPTMNISTIRWGRPIGVSLPLVQAQPAGAWYWAGACVVPAVPAITRCSVYVCQLLLP